MLCTDMMPWSANATLEQRERAFNGVGVGIPNNINSLGMIDGLVLFGFHARSLNSGRVRRVIVSKDRFGVRANVFSDVLSKCLGRHVFGMKQSKFSISLPNPNEDFFLIPAPCD